MANLPKKKRGRNEDDDDDDGACLIGHRSQKRYCAHTPTYGFLLPQQALVCTPATGEMVVPGETIAGASRRVYCAGERLTWQVAETGVWMQHSLAHSAHSIEQPIPGAYSGVYSLSSAEDVMCILPFGTILRRSEICMFGDCDIVHFDHWPPSVIETDPATVVVFDWYMNPETGAWKVRRRVYKQGLEDGGMQGQTVITEWSVPAPISTLAVDYGMTRVLVKCIGSWVCCPALDASIYVLGPIVPGRH